MRKETRLHFTKEEREAPALEKPIRRADRAAARADKAQAAIPKKKVRERIVDPDTGAVTVHLRFEDKKKPPSKLTHTLRDAPSGTVLGLVHREIGEAQEDNVGVEAAHKSEQAAEAVGRLVREGYRSHKLRPYRKAAAAERKLEKANINALYQKSLRENPQLASNPVSRWRQKQAIKQQYAAARHAGQAGTATGQAAAQTAHSAKSAARKGKRSANFVRRNKRGFLIAGGLLLAVAFFLNCMSSCSVLFSGVGGGVAGSTYPSTDEAMLEAEAAYAGMEADLQAYLDSYEANHSYDEYHFDLGEIGHDPYVLISLLTAYHQGAWALDQVQPTLEMLFDRQYVLTEAVVTETRYDEDDEPYTYYICYVTLEVTDLSHLPVYLLDEDRLSMYATYMAALGNRPDLFPQDQYPGASVVEDYLDYDVPPEALEDEQFAAMLAEAEKYLGFPYVWGGSSPSTSFDCSGFVSWVINHSGWDVGRLGAQSLFNLCTPVSAANAKPGDLVFFTGTYDSGTPVSHCGIYVGEGMMIHCGSPISYANLNSSYWQEHLYSYGRLP
mgnify:CR=1 FL=1